MKICVHFLLCDVINWIHLFCVHKVVVLQLSFKHKKQLVFCNSLAVNTSQKAKEEQFEAPVQD